MSKSSIISRFVPAGVEQRVTFLGQIITDAGWEIGGYVAANIQDIAEAQLQAGRGNLDWPRPDIEMLLSVGRMDIYYWWCSITGFSLRAITRAFAVASGFTQSERDEYDILPFSHFEAALTFGPARRIEFLEFSLDNIADNGGRPKSVEWLVSHFAAPANAAAVQAALDMGTALYDEPPGEELPFYADDELPMSPGAQYVLHRLSYALGALEKAVEKLQGEVQPSLYRRLRALLTDLSDTLREIAAEGEKERV